MHSIAHSDKRYQYIRTVGAHPAVEGISSRSPIHRHLNLDAKLSRQHLLCRIALSMCNLLLLVTHGRLLKLARERDNCEAYFQAYLIPANHCVALDVAYRGGLTLLLFGITKYLVATRRGSERKS